LFHAIDAADTAPYVSQFCCRITGPLQVERFQQAWQAAIARHDALRIAIEHGDRGEPCQRVWPDARMPFTVEDWGELSEVEQRQRLEAMAVSDRRRPFT